MSYTRLDTSAFNRGSLCISAATVNFLHHKHQCLQVAESSTSLRTQGAGAGWWWSRDTRQYTPPQLLLFYLSHPTVYTGCSAALIPAELLSQATSIAEVSLDLSMWYGLDSLAVRTLFLRGKPGDYGAVGVSYLKCQSLHYWVQQQYALLNFVNIVPVILNEFIFTLLSCPLEMSQINMKYLFNLWKSLPYMTVWKTPVSRISKNIFPFFFNIWPAQFSPK